MGIDGANRSESNQEKIIMTEETKKPEKGEKIKVRIPDFTDFDGDEFKRFSAGEISIIMITIILLIIAVIEYIKYLPVE